MARPDLDRLRRIQTAALDQRGVLERASSASDGMGGATQIWYTVANLPCSLGAPRHEGERVLVERLTRGAGWMLTLPWDAGAKGGDRFLLDGLAYQVVYVEDAVSYLTALRCVVEVR